MIHLRLAWILAYEILGTRWEAVCLTKGLDPSSATADDVLGPMRDDIWDGSGKRVLYLDDDRLGEVLDEMEAPATTQDPKAFVVEITQIAGLTRQETRVVRAIVNGSPIPDGKNYTEPLARQLNTTPKGVRNAWSRAKQKLRDNWAAE